MRYLDVCSGISAPTMAWKPLGWEALCFAEIEAFPRAVLKHHYPDVPLNGDFTRIEGNEYGPVDLLVGGTPCQSFSVAGLRGGIHDDRGNLALEFLRLAGRARPSWVVWENVPGVFSATSHDAPDPSPPQIDLDSGDGPRDGEEVVVEDEYDADESHAFACFLAGLSELGYGYAYRVLDAQYAGVPQRRRRVFVVGHLGDWRRAATVLFERHSLSGHPAPRRQKGSRTAGDASCGFEVGGTLGPRVSRLTTDECINGAAIVATPCGLDNDGETARALTAVHTATGRLDANEQTFIAFSAKDHGADAQDNLSPTLRAGGHANSHANAGVMPAVALAIRGLDGTPQAELGDEVANAVLTPNGGRAGIGVGAFLQASAVRRLTPRECERLQGFPDDFTLVPYRGKPAADGPRYKALGNSMAVPVVRWIGERIEAAEAIAADLEAAA